MDTLAIGPHMSIAKGFAKTAENAIKIGATAFQFFSRNPRGSNFRTGNEADIRQFQELRGKYGLGPLQAHAPYTMNLASPDDRVYRFAETVFREDVARMEAMKIEYFCLHPGSHLGSGEESGITRMAAALDRGIGGADSMTVLLETMPGKGTEIGYSFTQLRQIVERAECGDRLGVCMDLCHVFSAGYDIRGNLEGVLEAFDRELGLERLKTIHLNDSMTPFGSRKDRHCPIGEGQIGLEAVLSLMEHPVVKGLPFYTETPLDDEGHKQEIAMLKRLLEQRYDKTENPTSRKPLRSIKSHAKNSKSKNWHDKAETPTS